MLDNQIEYWVDIPNYEGCYEISNLGKIKSLDRRVDKYHHVKEKILTPTLLDKGYLSVMLSKNGKGKRFEVQRLMGFSFFGENISCVNHKDGNPQNNILINLEPCTYSENSNHAVDVLNVHSRARNVKVYNLKTNEIYKFNSMRKTEIFFNFPIYWLKTQRNNLGNVFTYNNYKFEVSENIS